MTEKKICVNHVLKIFQHYHDGHVLYISDLKKIRINDVFKIIQQYHDVNFL